MNHVHLKIVNERFTRHGDYRKLPSGEHAFDQYLLDTDDVRSDRSGIDDQPDSVEAEGMIGLESIRVADDEAPDLVGIFIPNRVIVGPDPGHDR